MKTLEEIKNELEGELRKYIKDRKQCSLKTFFFDLRLTEAKVAIAESLLNDIISPETNDLDKLRDILRIFKGRCEYGLANYFYPYTPKNFEKILINALKDVEDALEAASMPLLRSNYFIHPVYAYQPNQ